MRKFPSRLLCSSWCITIQLITKCNSIECKTNNGNSPNILKNNVKNDRCALLTTIHNTMHNAHTHNRTKFFLLLFSECSVIFFFSFALHFLSHYKKSQVGKDTGASSSITNKNNSINPWITWTLCTAYYE